MINAGLLLVIVGGCAVPAAAPEQASPSPTPRAALVGSAPSRDAATDGASPDTGASGAGERALSSGTVWVWGRYGPDMPVTTRGPKEVPERIRPLTGIVAVAAGLNHGLALDGDGTVWSWQEATLLAGQLSQNVRAARVVGGLRHIIAVSAGDNHSLALRADGTVWAWGQNLYGQLGDGTDEASSSPVPVVGLHDVVAVAAGSRHSLALLADGTVQAWGLGSLGQLGAGQIETRYHPGPVYGLAGVTTIAAGGKHNLAITHDGAVWAWGYALLGRAEETSAARVRPVRVEGVGSAVAVAAGWGHSLVLTNQGTVWAWGHNTFGELGDGAMGSPSAQRDDDLYDLPRGEVLPVPGLHGIVAIAAGEHHSLALRGDGTLLSWGSNVFGELGSNRKQEPVFRTVHGPVPGLHSVTAIAAHGVHSLALQGSFDRPLPAPRFRS